MILDSSLHTQKDVSATVLCCIKNHPLHLSLPTLPPRKASHRQGPLRHAGPAPCQQTDAQPHKGGTGPSPCSDDDDRTREGSNPEAEGIAK